jgi:heptosyltransferase I
MKILIVKLSSIGDIIHTLPVISAIKRSMPDAEISWIVEKKSAEILRNNEILHKLIEIDTHALRKSKSLTELRNQRRILREDSYDVSLDFQGLLKSATIAKLTKSKKRFGFAKKSLREPASRFLLNKKIEVPNNIHIIRKNLALAEQALQIAETLENFEFPIFTDAKHRLEAQQIIERSGENLAIINPAGGWVTKLWSAEKYGELADKLFEEKGLISVVSFAPNEEMLAERVIAASKTKKIVKAKLSLKGFYELAKRAKIYVGGDTGPTHIAVAANCPIVGIFGPTEWWRNGSPNSADICVERTEIDCRVDCHRRKCGNWICMDISVDRVFSAIEKRLENS